MVVLVKPAGLLMKFGLAVMVKSHVTDVTVTATVVDRDGRLPDVPVTVTWYVCSGVFEAAHTFSVDVAEPPLGTETLFGVMVIVRVGSLGLTDVVNATVPWKPKRLDTVIVEVPHEPWPIVNDVGLAESLKSTAVTWTVIVAVCTIPPLVPVTLTWNVPTVEPEIVMENAALGGSVTLDGAPVTVSPEPDVTLVVIVTVPANPLTPLTLIVDIALWPCGKLTLDGVALTVKSVTFNVSHWLVAGLLNASPL